MGSGAQVGEFATSPLPSRGSPSPQSGGRNQKWPTGGCIGYIILPSRGLQRFRAATIITGPKVGGLATSPLSFGGFPTLQSGGQNQKWPTRGRIGCITPAVWGVPDASKQTQSEMPLKWDGLHNPCRLGGYPTLNSCPQVGGLAT